MRLQIKPFLLISFNVFFSRFFYSHIRSLIRSSFFSAFVVSITIQFHCICSGNLIKLITIANCKLQNRVQNDFDIPFDGELEYILEVRKRKICIFFHLLIEFAQTNYVWLHSIQNNLRYMQLYMENTKRENLKNDRRSIQLTKLMIAIVKRKNRWKWMIIMVSNCFTEVLCNHDQRQCQHNFSFISLIGKATTNTTKNWVLVILVS